MKIWIVHHDIAFASDLKKEITALKLPGILKVVLFYEAASFATAIKKSERDSSLKPHLIFCDTQLDDMDLIAFYQQLYNEKPELADLFVFCTAVGYGHFASLCESRGAIPLPPFLLKGQALKQVASFMVDWLAAESIKGINLNKSEASNLSSQAQKKSPQGAQHEKKLKEGLKNFVDTYYRIHNNKEEILKLVDSLAEIKALLRACSDPFLEKRIDKILALRERKGISVMRLKRDVRDLVLLSSSMVSPE